MDENAVYMITKTIYENLAFLNNIHKATKAMKLENAIVGLPFPLHPGAAKYYQGAASNSARLLVNKPGQGDASEGRQGAWACFGPFQAGDGDNDRKTRRSRRGRGHIRQTPPEPRHSMGRSFRPLLYWMGVGTSILHLYLNTLGTMSELWFSALHFGLLERWRPSPFPLFMVRARKADWPPGLISCWP